MSGDDLARLIGGRVRFHRAAARRTKTVVAGLAGITPDYLYQIERGQKVPTLSVLTQLADVLGVSASELLGERPQGVAARAKTTAGDAIYQALVKPLPSTDEPLTVPVLRGRISDAWSIWQTSPHRYSQLVARKYSVIP